MNPENNLSSQMQFVILCCKSEMDEHDTKVIRENVTATEDLEEVSMLAYGHGVYPLFYHTLMEHASDLLGQETKDAMAYLNLSIIDKNKKMSEELIDLYELLAKYGISLIPYKGAALSQLAYGDITKRQYSDIDALINEQNLFKTIELLKQNKYTIIEDEKHLKNKTCYKLLYDFAAIGKKYDTYFEIHWKSMYDNKRKKIDETFISNNLQTINIHNKELTTFNNELYLAYICYHGNKHAWERLIWICDVDRLIRSTGSSIDYDKVLSMAENMNAAKTLFLGLNLVSNMFDTPINWDNDHYKNKEFDNLRISIMKRFFTFNDNTNIYANNFFITMHNVKTMDRISQKIRYLLTFYFGVKIADCVTLLLPDQLSFLYPILKPFIFTYRKIQKKLISTKQGDFQCINIP